MVDRVRFRCGLLVFAVMASAVVPRSASAQPMQTLSADSSAVFHLTFTPDGTQLMSLHADGTVRIWDVGSSGTVKVAGRLEDYVGMSSVLSADGKSLLTHDSDAHILVDIDSRKRILTIPGDAALAVDLSRSQKLIAAGSEDGRYRVWERETGALKWASPKRDSGDTSLGRLAISPDDKLLATTEGGGSVTFWDIDSGKELKTCLLNDSIGNAICFSPDARSLAYAGGGVDLFDVQKETHTNLEGDLIDVMCFSHDGSLLAGGTYGGQVFVWDTKTGKTLARFEGQGERSSIDSLAFSRDATLVAAGSDGGTIGIWEFLKNKERLRQEFLAAQFHELDTDGDGKLTRNEWMGAHEPNLAASDVDLDEQISFDEYVRWQETRPADHGIQYDPLRLVFDWPDDVQLQVTRTYERQDQIFGKIRTTSGVCRYRLTGRRTDEEYRVTMTDYAVVKREPLAESDDSLVMLESEVRQFEPQGLSIVFRDPATPPSVDGLSDAVAQFKDRISKIPGIAADEAAQAFVRACSSQDYWRLRALEDWNQMVQVWIGAELNVGLSHYREITVPNPLTGPTTEGVSFLIERQFAADQVRLVAQRTPSPEMARRILLQLFSNDQTTALLGRKDTQVIFQSLYVTDCDPNTLVPKRFLKHRVWQIGIKDADGQRQRIGRTETWTCQFAPVSAQR